MRSPSYWLVSQEMVQEMSYSLDCVYCSRYIKYLDLKYYVKQFKANVM